MSLTIRDGAQEALRQALRDLADDLVSMVPEWRKQKGPLSGLGEVKPNKDSDIPGMKIETRIRIRDPKEKLDWDEITSDSGDLPTSKLTLEELDRGGEIAKEREGLPSYKEIRDAISTVLTDPGSVSGVRQFPGAELLGGILSRISSGALEEDERDVPLEAQTPESLIAYIRSLEGMKERLEDLLAVVRKRFPVDPDIGKRSSPDFRDVEILATLIGIDALYPERKA